MHRKVWHHALPAMNAHYTPASFVFIGQNMCLRSPCSSVVPSAKSVNSSPLLLSTLRAGHEMQRGCLPGRSIAIPTAMD